jgi:hypothetical protein
MTADQWRRAQAKLRIERALAQIQEAQYCLDRAAAELSSLCYGHPAQKRVSKLYDRVHAEWYRTAELRNDRRVVVDREPTKAELGAPDPAETMPRQPLT